MKAQSHWTITRSTARLFVATSLVLGVPLLAQADDGARGPNADVSAQSLVALKTFTGGGTEVTISNHGNVIQFESPIGSEHITNGSIEEGYILCNSGTNRFDLADIEAGFGPAVTSCPTATTCTVTRNTSDGLMQLKQNFTFVAAEKRLRIAHTVKNLSGAPLFGVVLRRQADFDIEENLTGSFTNNHAATEQDAVFAWNDAADDASSVGHGMILRHVTPNATRQAKVNFFESSCSPADQANGAPVNGDFTDTLEYNLGTINSGASKSVTVDYERHL